LAPVLAVRALSPPVDAALLALPALSRCESFFVVQLATEAASRRMIGVVQRMT
jgi:hypothetical protein